MKRYLRLFLGMVCLLVVSTVEAQLLNVRGIIRDKATGVTLPGVSVMVKGTARGCASDIDGRFEVQANSNDVLTFTFVGMKDLEMPVGGRTSLEVMMEEASEVMEEVMVVAYGTARKESFTGSAEVIGSKQLEKRTLSNVTKAIDGTVAGVQTSSGSGQPGSGAQIIIRGIGSINASSTPLYVVDGVPFEGSLNSINPEDIETMSILKDASASALYGSRGANGVVIITTKKGQQGKVSINFKANVGIQQRAIPKYELLDAGEFMEASWDYARLGYQGMSDEQARETALQNYMQNLGGEQYNPFTLPSEQLIDPATGKMVDGVQMKWHDDWLDEAMRSTPIRQEYSLTARGGNDRSQFMISGAYLKEEGLILQSGFDRLSLRGKIDALLKDWWKAGLSIGLSLTKTNNIMSSGSDAYNVWYAGMLMGPIYPLYVRDTEGNVVLENGVPQYDFGGTRPFLSNSHTIALLHQDKNTSKNDNASVRAYFELGDKTNAKLGFLKDFKFTVNLGADYKLSSEHQFLNPFTGSAETTNGRMTKTNQRMLSYTMNELLSYNRSFGKHTLDVLAGHEYYDLSTETLSGIRTGFMFSDEKDLVGGTTIIDANSYGDNYRIQAFLSRLNYNFADKYYLSASFRTDGSSRFHKDNRWGNFWSVGASWRMSEEHFMKSLAWLNNLTLKVSYGQQGNDAVGTYYAWQRTYQYGYANGSFPGVATLQLENKNLKWEKNNNLNFGIEAKMFHQRLSVSLEAYLKKTEDMLLYKTLPISSGYSGIYENIGSMKNRGFDFTFSGIPVQTQRFHWQSTLLVSRYNNEVTALAGGEDRISLGNRVIQVGEAAYSFYMYKAAGVDPETGNQLYWTKEGEKTPNASQAEKEILGSRIPDVYGSFSNDFSYRGFDLQILLTYSLGGKILDNNYTSLMTGTQYGTNFHKDMARRWRKPGDITDVPRLASGYIPAATDRFLVDASYLGIKNISLGYTFDLKGLGRAGIRALRLSVTGDNLHTFTKLKGINPQFDFTGGQAFTYIPVRNISFGIDLSF